MNVLLCFACYLPAGEERERERVGKRGIEREGERERRERREGGRERLEGGRERKRERGGGRDSVRAIERDERDEHY